MSVTTGQVTTLLENVLFESPTVAAANAPTWVGNSASIPGEGTVAGLAAALAATPEAQIAQQVVRYYLGALNRVPSGSEIAFYVAFAEKGLTAAELAQGSTAVPSTTWTTISTFFAASPEFSQDYGLGPQGALNAANEALVITAFYANILGRAPSASDIAFYEKALASGITIPQLLVFFTISPEYQSEVDSSLATALASNGTSVVNGTTPTTIPLLLPGSVLTESLTSSALTVSGTDKSTVVTVTGTPAQTAQSAASAVTGVIGVAAVAAATGVQGVAAVAAVTPVAAQTAQSAVTDGAVTINDANSSATGAGTITTITLADSGAGSVINDNGLASLTLTGTVGTLAITNSNSAAIAAHASTLALTLDGLTVPANMITDSNNEIATLTVTTANHDSTLAGFADTNLTTLTVAGTNKLTLKAINSSLTSLTVSGGAGFSDGASVHGTGLAANQANLAITDSSTGSFTAVLDDTTQSFTGADGTDIITVSALTDATKTITAGSATNNEIIFEGGAYALTSASAGKFVNFQTVGVAGNVTGTIDLSVIDAGAATLEVLGASSVAFINAAKGATLLLDPSTGAAVSVSYADSTGASDSAGVTMSSNVTSLSLQDSAATGIATVSVTNNLAATETNVSAAHVLATLTDTGLSTLMVSGSAGLTIGTLSEIVTGLTLNDGSTDGYGVTITTLTDTAMSSLAFTGSGVSTVGTLSTGATSFSVTNGGTTLDAIGTLADNTLTSLTLAANVALGQAATASTSNGLQDGSSAGVAVSGSADNAHVTVNLTAGAASGKTDSITLGNGNDIVVDASTAGTVTITLGSGANLVELGTGSLDTTAHFAVTLAARTATPPNVIFVGAAGTNYASAPNVLISGATAGDIIAFGSDPLSSNTALTATSLSGASSIATAVTTLEAAATSAHKVVYGVYGGNTYIVETITGTTGITDTAVVEVTGSQTLTASSGYVTLGSTASTLTGGGLAGAGFTIPAGTATNLTLGTGGNVVTLVGPSTSVDDTFTSLSTSIGLTVDYQATSGTDTIFMSGSAGTTASDINSLTVNDTSSASAGLIIGAFTDNGLTSATYNNSAATGATITQQAITSSSLTSINFTGGVSGKATNSYFFSGTLATSGTLTINDTNIGSGSTTMGLNLAGGPSALTLTMTGPGTLATGALADNNLAAITITGSGTGNVNIGTLTDSLAAAFTVTDSSSSTGGTVMVLAGLSAATGLTITDTATGALLDSSAYADSGLTSMTLKNSGAGLLTVGAGGIAAAALTSISLTSSGSGGVTLGSGGISAAALASISVVESGTGNVAIGSAGGISTSALTAISISGSGSGTVTFGTLTDSGAGPLTVTDSSTSSGAATLALSGISAATALTVTDSASAALGVGNLIADAALATLSLTNSGSAGLTVGTVTSNALTTLSLSASASGSITVGNISSTALQSLSLTDTGTSGLTLGTVTSSSLATLTLSASSTGGIAVGNITDSAASAVTVNDSSTSAVGQSLTFASLPNATSLLVSDSAQGAFALSIPATLAAAALTFDNTGTAQLTVSGLTDSAATLGLTLGGSGTGAQSITLSDSGATSLSITDTSSSLGTATVTPTLTGGLASLAVSDSGAGALSIGALTDLGLTTLSLSNSGSATLTASGITNATTSGAGVFATLSLAGSGAIVTALTSGDNAPFASPLLISDADTGAVSITTLTVGGTSADTAQVTVTNDNSASGSLTVSSNGTTSYVTSLTLNNSSASGTNNVTLTDGASAATTVSLTGSGVQTLNLTDNAGVVTLSTTGNTNLTLNHNAISGDQITLGNGVNSVTLNDSTLTDTVTVDLGIGSNTIAMNAARTVGSTFQFQTSIAGDVNNTPVTADAISGFLRDTAGTLGDTIKLGFTSANIVTTSNDANSGISTFWTVSNGMMSKAGASVLNFIAAVQTITQAGGGNAVPAIAGFYDGTNSWIAYNDHSGSNVAVIELVGVAVSGLETNGAQAGFVHIG
jgi:hypothetical protein